MGGSSRKQTVGYKHFLYQYLVWCLGPVDKMLRLEFDKRLATQGNLRDGRHFINKPGLFGGKKKEGGVSGWFDLMLGHPDQVQNDYMVAKYGAGISANRGVVSTVFRKMYLGNTPYFKTPAAQFQRVHTAPDGGDQWYPEKAEIPNLGFTVSGAAIYIAMDASGSMAGARQAIQKQAVADLLREVRDNAESPNDVRIVLWDNTEVTSTQRRNCDEDDYDALIAWVEALSDSIGGDVTNFAAAVASAKGFFDGAGLGNFWDTVDFPSWSQSGSFFGSFGEGGSKDKRRILLFLTDGEPNPEPSAATAAATLAAINYLETYCFNIDLADTSYSELLDNTPDDGVPVVDDGDSGALTAAFQAAFPRGSDYNPAHFLRDLLLHPRESSRITEAKIGDSFNAAADTLHADGHGVSLRFDAPSDRAANIEEVERHINGRVFRSRATGKYELKLVRGDYDINDMHTFDRSNVIEWQDFRYTLPKHRPNQVTLTYTQPDRNETRTISHSNPIRVTQAGRVIDEPRTYRGCRNDAFASKLLFRDLRSVTNLGWTGRIVAFEPPIDVDIGDAVILDNDDIGLSNVVFRIVDIIQGDGRDNAFEIDLAEDVFHAPAIGLNTPPLVVKPPRPANPRASQYRMVEEAPYYELVQLLGHRDADNRLADEASIGYLNYAAENPSGDALGADVMVDAGAGYEVRDTLEYVPAYPLLSSLSSRPDHTIVLVEKDSALQGVRIGSIASIGTEFVRIDAVSPGLDVFAVDDVFAMDDVFGDVAVITLGRGCLDTAPQEHASGAALIFWGDAPDTDGVEYFDGESVDIKMLTITGLGSLDEDSAPADTVEFASRAIRPFAPGNFRMDGGFAPMVFADSLDLTWAHRDRTQQTGATFDDHLTGNIGPEAGVAYRLDITALDAALDDLALVQTIDKGQLLSHSYTQSTDGVLALLDVFAAGNIFSETGYPTGTHALRFTITSLRDGYEAWQAPSLIAHPFQKPIILSITEI